MTESLKQKSLAPRPIPRAGGTPWRIAHSESSLGWGGQEHRVLAELLGFREYGSVVHLIAPSASAVAARATAENIPTHDLPTGKPGLVASVFELADWLGRNRIDVLNTHSSRDGWFVGLAGRLAGVPLIIRSRHIDVDYGAPWLSRHAFTTLADHVLTTSNQIRDRLHLRLSLPTGRATTLPTGIDLHRFSPSGATHPHLRKLRKAGRRLIGMVSVIRSWKGHRTFVDTAMRLIEQREDTDFVITGEGPFLPIVEGWLSQSPYRDRFHLLGHVEEVPAVLRSLDVLAIPSLRHEGVPQIGLQALACGTPVVGSDIGGIPEIIRPGETGRIFPAEDVAAFAAALTAALGEKKETARLVSNGRAMVEAHHGRRRMIEVLDGLYRRLLASKRPDLS